MYKIAICDDEKSTCVELENFIKHYGSTHFIKIETEVFYSGKTLCTYLEQNEYFELLFLDIGLPNIDGIDVGHFIRTTMENEQTDIVYVSSEKNYALQLFQYRPLDFFIKPITYEMIENILGIFVKRRRISDIFFECLVNRTYQRIKLSNIIYFKSDNKKINLYSVSGEMFTFYGKLEEIRLKLPEEMFLTIHKSYIINYKYVNKYTYEWMEMVNGDILTISKSHRKEVRSKLLQYEQ